MSRYFPFTDYDFYAYLTSGSLLLAVIDYVFNDAAIITLNDWTFVQIVLAVALAYVVGHLVAWLSQMIIEMWIMRSILTAPSSIQLGSTPPNRVERLIGHAVGRYYEPFTFTVRQKIIEVAANTLNRPASELTDAEDVFQVAHRRAMELDVVRARSDEFRNLYGLFRNLTMVGLLSTAMLTGSGWFGNGGSDARLLALVVAALSVATFVRFAKFYASFSAEILRSLLK